MEVHHHPDLHHKKKNFREYFLEFLMIFLAVTMGFIAESLREHLTEHSKEKQYIEGLVRNLKDDTASLRSTIIFDSIQVKGIDSMLMLARADMNNDTCIKRFYHLSLKYLFNSATFKSNDATLQQLKSTGDYRLIEKDHAADSLSGYDASIQSVYSQGDYYEQYFKEILSQLDEMTDMTLLNDTAYVQNFKFTNKPFPPLRNAADRLPTFFNKVTDFRIVTASYAQYNLKPLLAKASALIAFLKKEYGLED